MPAGGGKGDRGRGTGAGRREGLREGWGSPEEGGGLHKRRRGGWKHSRDDVGINTADLQTLIAGRWGPAALAPIPLTRKLRPTKAAGPNLREMLGAPPPRASLSRDLSCHREESPAGGSWRGRWQEARAGGPHPGRGSGVRRR